MAYVDKTLFEVTVSNSVNNQTQNVPGKFGTFADNVFTGDVCSAGTICVQHSLIPSEGYEALDDGNGGTVSILNGNTWYFTVAANGAAGSVGDHTGLYFCNTYDVAKATIGNDKVNIGAKTLGLSLPADVRGDFTEAIVGEQYTFGVGNFSTAPGTGVTTGYATISNGFLVYTATKPTTEGTVYFELLRAKNMNEGVKYVGLGYVLKCHRVTSVQSI